MRQPRPRSGFLFCLLALPLAATAYAETELSGQWIGNSQVEGDSSVAKTSLSLSGASDENATLRLEGRSNCTLRDGKVTSAADGAWNLSFKDARGGDVCARLAKGTFVLHPGSTPRQLVFDVTYPGPDGNQNQRHGALHRYP
ncbi:MAG TPA: hypothetical protein VF132_09035 [Rudaea sp.]